MGTQLDSSNVLEFGNNLLRCAPIGTALIPSPFPTPMPLPWQVVGRVTSDGFTGGREVSNTKEYDSTGALAFEGWAELNETVAFTAMETNNVTESLAFPGSARTTPSAGTAETQTVTVSGTPTGGTFTPVYKGVASTIPVANNATAATLQTSLQTIPALASIPVPTGSAGGPYVVTLPASEGDAPLLSFINSLTGGTNPSVASVQTSAGVAPVYQWITSSASITSPPSLLWALDEIHVASGLASRRYFVGKASLTDPGAITKGASRKRAFSITKYEDLQIGGLERIVSTLPAYLPSAAIV